MNLDLYRGGGLPASADFLFSIVNHELASFITKYIC